jgi:ABC-2 type transport system permease protein
MLESFFLYRRLLGAHIKSQMQYRTSFVLDVFSTALFTLTEFGAFVLVFSRFSSLGGWSLVQVMLLYGMVEFGFGIMDMVFAGFDPPFFGNLIRKGTLDQLLLRPRGLVLQIFAADFTLRRIGRIFFGACILGYALFSNPIDWSLEKALLLLLACLGMILYFGALFLVGATIQFWTVESSEAMNVLTYGGGYLMSYPMNIYPEWMRVVFTFIVPAALMNFYPALYILGKPDPFGLPPQIAFLSPVAGITMFGLALVFWRFGLKHYQGTGT